MLNNLPTMDFELVREQIATLRAAVSNKLEREWPSRWASQRVTPGIVRSLVLVSGTTYQTVIFLCKDKPLDPFHLPEFAISTPPLVRSILDILFTVVFLFDNLAVNTTWFCRSGWRETQERYQLYRRTYGSDPRWASWLQANAQLLEWVKADWGISPDEIANPRRIPWWPNPGQMLRHQSLSADRRAYLSYLNDWFYRDLSSASHLSWPGLAERSCHLLTSGDHRDAVLNRYRSNCVATAVSLLLALLSEIEIECRFQLNERLKYVWGVLNAFFDESKDLYELRYSRLL